MNEKLTKYSSHLVEARPFTKDIPTVAGWYWYRDDAGCTIVEVYITDLYLAIWMRGVKRDVSRMNGTWCPIPLPTDAPAQGFYRAEDVERVLENCVAKWRSQNGAREGVNFRIAMKNIEALLDRLRGGV